MRKLVVFLFIFACIGAEAQYKKAFEDLFQQTSGWPMSGWVFGAGATYTLPVNKLQHNYTMTPGNLGDLKTYSFPGIYAEIGRFHLVPSGIIFNNLDYTVAFKQINYRQQFTPTNTVANYTADKAQWQDNNISVNFNLNSVIQFADYQWIQPSLGIHGDYRLGGKTSYSSDSINYPYTIPDNKLNVQLHAKLAYGAKLTSELFIVPSIEIGLWRLDNLTQLRIPRTVFNSNYTPVIFCIKFLLHRPFNLKPCDIEVEDVDLSNTKRSKKKPKLF